MAKSNAVQLAQHVGAAITADGASGIITAASFVGSGANLTGIDATSIKDSGGTIRAQAYTAGVTVTGVLTATSFDGDGSALTGLPAGLGTAIAASGDGALFYYTDQTLEVGANLTLDTPATTPIYTQYSDIAVSNGVDLTVADGDELVTDILGIGTAGSAALSGTGGRVRADTVTSRTTLSPVDFPSGITGVAATFTGNVTVGGTITYEDVQNVDSVGVVTAGKGLRVTTEGIVVTAGVSTLGGGTTMGDSVVSYWGTGGDLQIYHNGSHSVIKDAGTGNLLVYSNNIAFNNAADTEAIARFNEDGNCELYYDGTKKIETTAAGVSIAGTVSDSGGDLRSLVVNSQTSAYTLVAADAGKMIKITTGGVTCPNGAGFSAGDMITILNESGSDQTITEGGGATLYNTADGTTGNRTLAGRGVATIVMTGSSAYYISGSGLS